MKPCLKEHPPKLLPDSEKKFLTLLSGAMLQTLGHQRLSVMPLAATGCFTPSTRPVETASSSLPFLSQASLSKNVLTDCDQ